MATIKSIVPRSELAAEKFAYIHLERLEAEIGILAAIETDLAAGMTPDQIGSIWRRVSRFTDMPRMVELAARYVARINQE